MKMQPGIKVDPERESGHIKTEKFNMSAFQTTATPMKPQSEENKRTDWASKRMEKVPYRVLDNSVIIQQVRHCFLRRNTEHIHREYENDVLKNGESSFKRDMWRRQTWRNTERRHPIRRCGQQRRRGYEIDTRTHIHPGRRTGELGAEETKVPPRLCQHVSGIRGDLGSCERSS